MLQKTWVSSESCKYRERGQTFTTYYKLGMLTFTDRAFYLIFRETDYKFNSFESEIDFSTLYKLNILNYKSTFF